MPKIIEEYQEQNPEVKIKNDLKVIAPKDEKFVETLLKTDEFKNEIDKNLNLQDKIEIAVKAEQNPQSIPEVSLVKPKPK